MNADQQFLEYLVKGLVDQPESVKVVRSVDDMGVLLLIEVAATDMGKIIGREGKTIDSIRIIMRVVGMKNSSRVNVKVKEPVGGLKSAEYLAANPTTSAPISPSPTRQDGTQSASRSLDEVMADLKLE